VGAARAHWHEALERAVANHTFRYRIDFVITAGHGQLVRVNDAGAAVMSPRWAMAR
jgi:hypothetical protein